MADSKRTILLFWLIVLVVVLPNSVIADEFKLIPSLAVRGEYNDNIFYTDTDSDQDDDYIITVSPGLELIERTQRFDLNLAGTVSPFYYDEHTDLDAVDQNYRGRTKYQVSQLFSVNADALYDVSNRRDRDVETSGIIESNDERKRWDLGCGFEYTITEKAAMAASFGYLTEEWDTEEIQDLDAYNAGLSFTYNLSKWWSSTIGRLNMGFARYEYDTSDTYYYNGSIGVQHWFSETVNLTVDLGARYTDSDYDRPQLIVVPPGIIAVQIVEENNTDLGGSGEAILEILGELTRGSIRIGYGVLPGGSRETPVERTDAVLSLRRRLAERAAFVISTGYYKNKADRDQFTFNEIDEDSYFVRPRIRWEFFENFTLEAGYSFTYVEDNVDEADFERNLAYLQLAYGLPLFE